MAAQWLESRLDQQGGSGTHVLVSALGVGNNNTPAVPDTTTIHICASFHSVSITEGDLIVWEKCARPHIPTL